MAESVFAEFSAKMQEYEERRTRQHNEIMTLLREFAVSRGCDMCDWSSSAGVEGVEGIQSDNGCETGVVVKTSGCQSNVVVKQSSEQYPSLLTKHPMVTQAVQASGITMPLPTSKVILQENVKQDLGPKHVVLDPVLANQKEHSIIKELGCKSFRITLENRDLEDSSGGGGGDEAALEIGQMKKLSPKIQHGSGSNNSNGPIVHTSKKMADELFKKIQSDYDVVAHVGFVSHQKNEATYGLNFDTRSDVIFGQSWQQISGPILCFFSNSNRLLQRKIWDPEINQCPQSNTLRTRCFWGWE